MSQVRIELTLQLDPKDVTELRQVATELEAGLSAEKWECLVALSRAVVRQVESLSTHSTIPDPLLIRPG